MTPWETGSVTDAAQITIPAGLLPTDGRFGSGPSKVRPEQVRNLAALGTTYLGTSHRQSTVKDVVGRLRTGLCELFSLPDGYEVVLGNGGTTAFWEVATFCLVQDKAQHLTFGEFGAKFGESTKAAPFLADPVIVSSEPGDHPDWQPVLDDVVHEVGSDEPGTTGDQQSHGQDPRTCGRDRPRRPGVGPSSRCASHRWCPRVR